MHAATRVVKNLEIAARTSRGGGHPRSERRTPKGRTRVARASSRTPRAAFPFPRTSAESSTDFESHPRANIDSRDRPRGRAFVSTRTRASRDRAASRARVRVQSETIDEATPRRRLANVSFFPSRRRRGPSRVAFATRARRARRGNRRRRLRQRGRVSPLGQRPRRASATPIVRTGRSRRFRMFRRRRLARRRAPRRRLSAAGVDGTFSTRRPRVRRGRDANVPPDGPSFPRVAVRLSEVP